jgi:hypothetical protein
MMKKKLAIFLGLLLFLLPLFSVSSSDSKSYSPKKITYLDGKLYVLAPKEQSISQYDLSGKQVAQFDLKLPPDAVDFVAFQGKLFVIFTEDPTLFVYKPSGEFFQAISTGVLKPSAIQAVGDYLLIADTMGIWVLDAQAEPINLLPYPKASHEAVYRIESMAWAQNRLYLACGIHQEVYVYASEGQAGRFAYLSTLGGYGSETGRHKKLSGLAVYGKLWLCDSAKNGFEEHNLLTGEIQLRGLQSSLPSFSDILVAKDRIYLCSANSDTLYSFPLSEDSSRVFLPFFSHESIDFGSISMHDPAQEKLMIYSQNALPMKGKLSSDHPAIWVHPSEFDASENPITVTINPGHLKVGMELSANLRIEFTDGQRQLIPIKAKVATEPDFRVRFPFPPAFSSRDKALEVFILGQNKLQDDFELINFKESDPFVLKKNREGVFRIQIQDNPDPGFYTLRFQVRSPRIRSVRYFSFNFLYRSPENSLNGSVLAEYFAADWCRFCPSGHRAFLELRNLYSRSQLNSLTYYNDCLEDTPERLCFSGSEQRMRWYMPQGTHVSLFLNGGNPIHGGLNSPDATMLNEYREAIDPLLKQGTPISLSASLELDPDQRMLDIGATVIQTHPHDYYNLRLYCVIAENEIELPVSTGQTMHNFVARQFISLDSSTKAAIEGTELTRALRNDLHLQARIDDLINVSRAYLLLFVQDYHSKKVYQTLYLPLQNIPALEADFELSSPLTRYLARSANPIKVYFELQNTGNCWDSYDLSLNTEEAFLEEAYLMDLFEKEKGRSLATKVMNPGEKRSFALVLPHGLDATRKFGIFARSQRFEKEKELALTVVDDKIPMNPTRLLFPPPSALDSEKGYVASHHKLNLCWYSDGKMRFDRKEGEDAGFAGVRYHSLLLSPGKHRYVVNVYHGNNEATGLELFIHRPLKLVLTINSHIVSVNNEKQILDVAPFISKQNRTMVPLRFIAESFGAQVNFEAKTHSIELIFYNNRITMQVGNNIAVANGKEIQLDSSPLLVNQRTFVPLRAIAELIKAEIYWDAKLQEVHLTM